MVDFGSFSSLEEAIDERDELEEYGWPFLKENPKNKFVEKYIYEDDGKYFVSKTILDVDIIYGVFDSLDKAKSLDEDPKAIFKESIQYLNGFPSDNLRGKPIQIANL